MQKCAKKQSYFFTIVFLSSNSSLFTCPVKINKARAIAFDPTIAQAILKYNEILNFYKIKTPTSISLGQPDNRASILSASVVLPTSSLFSLSNL